MGPIFIIVVGLVILLLCWAAIVSGKNTNDMY